MIEINAQNDSPQNKTYQVLARKYRSQSFAELIGQDALVRTLTNAIESARIHHAYMFTGVRGTGKTSTARIVAKSLNCIGKDGQSGPTPSPCGVCENCQAIAADRHVDVIEMDAASHTGVDDMRDVIDSARYAPVSARYKVYIIDEVHMLSKSAFNALLKTLEEPPPHIVFIFATTEIRKVPTTILSRCQRFDLKRVEIPTLTAHYKKIAAAEGVSIDDQALNLIARAADGSVRDGLSLLDQAISQSGGAITLEHVQSMLGQVDSARIYDLFTALMSGDGENVIQQLASLYTSGAAADVILNDLLEAVHLITRIKVTPALAESDEISMIERTQGGELANKLAMPILTRAWQMLLKGVGELQAAPMPMKALEMVLIRLIYAGMLPTPEEILQESEKTGQNAPTAQKKTLDSAGHKPAKEPSTEPLTPRAPTIPQNAKHHSDAPQKEPQDTIDTPVAAATDLPVDPNSKEENHDFVALVALMREKGESLLASQCSTFISVVDFAPPSMTLYIDPAAPKDIKACMTRFLNEHTEHTWQIQPAQEKGAPTLKEQQKARESAAIEAITAHNDMQKVLEKCPPHRIIGVNDLQKNETGKDSTL